MPRSRRQNAKGPSQRQLRAGELVRHALVDILAREEFNDPELSGISITISEVRMSPDLRHASCFVTPLGAAAEEQDKVAKALNRASSFLRGRLGHEIEMKFTPQLRFLVDDSYEEAGRIGALLASPSVARDLNHVESSELLGKDNENDEES
ncbi:MAG: ribosome-binding factor A [Hirschia sp.]|nr:ribosome-binding factor A [Hirschia sp.]MBF18630.1 ribosome-binding factor A [Hirschia sp.]